MFRLSQIRGVSEWTESKLSGHCRGGLQQRRVSRPPKILFKRTRIYLFILIEENVKYSILPFLVAHSHTRRTLLLLLY